jgi:CCR4-NOT transcriptional regulation complex NOT5 subunit
MHISHFNELLKLHKFFKENILILFERGKIIEIVDLYIIYYILYIIYYILFIYYNIFFSK